MKAILTIKMDNVAFEPDNGLELAAILRHLADSCEAREQLTPGDMFLARDFNGKSVGELRVKR